MVHTELKLTECGPRVIEVNGRLGGLVADLLRRGAACDVIADAMRLALGQPAATEPVFNQVTYQYTLVPPMHSRRLLSLQGIDRLKSLPGVDLVDVRAVPGQALDWRAGAAARLGRVHGQVADHKELARLIAEIEAAYEGTYAYSEGENC
jgi:hypothetical protein